MDNIINNEGLLHALKMISPGTPLRKGLENVLRAKTGGLIVLDSNEEVMKIVDGGFRINAEYSPAYLYELAKMDGAIVLSEDSKRILLANTQLIPNYNIPTTETGTRHRTAERVARQTGAIVISISQRRNVTVLTLFSLKEWLKPFRTVPSHIPHNLPLPPVTAHMQHINGSTPSE